jgi:hypothetical protein
MKNVSFSPHSVRRAIQHGSPRKLIASVIWFGRRTRAKLGRTKHVLDAREVATIDPNFRRAYCVVMAGSVVVTHYPLRPFATIEDTLSPQARSLLVAFRETLRR